MIPTRVLKSLSISGGAGDLNLIESLSTGQGKDVSALPWHQYVTVYFLLFFSDLRVGTKTPRRISATGCTVLLLFGVSVTSSPEDLSTSPNSF